MVKELQHSALLSKVKASNYFLKSSGKIVSEEKSREVVSLERRPTCDNVKCWDSARVALSPIITEQERSKFYIYIFDKATLGIDIWESTFYGENYFFEHFGVLEITDTERKSSLAAENSGEDFNKVSGNVSCFNLYVSCPESSLVKCVRLPRVASSTELQRPNTVSCVNHESLKRPTSLAVARKDGEVSLAVISGLCGRVFLFRRKEFDSFRLVTILASNLLSPSSTICFDSLLRVWASDYDRSTIVCYANNGETERIFPTSEHLSGIHCLSRDVLLGWDSKSNSIGRLLKEDGKKLLQSIDLGSCHVFRPIDVATSIDTGILLVAGRSSANNYPVVSVFRLQMNPSTNVCSGAVRK